MVIVHWFLRPQFLVLIYISTILHNITFFGFLLVLVLTTTIILTMADILDFRRRAKETPLMKGHIIDHYPRRFHACLT